MSIAGNRIKECRIASQMTQDDVAKHLGIGKQAVYKYEIGAVTNIPLENIVKMSSLFQVSPCYLAGWSDVKEPVVIHESGSDLPEDETLLLDGYRSLTPDGKKYMLSQLVAAKAIYGEKDISSSAAEP